MNRIILTAAVLIFGIAPVTRYLLADEQPATDSPAVLGGSENDDKQQRRIRLAAKAHQHFLDGNIELAIDLTQKVASLERELFGENSDRVAWRLRRMVDYLLELEHPDDAVRFARQSAELVRATHSEASWQVEDADRFIQVVDAVSTLPRTKRQQFLQASRQFELAQQKDDLKASLEASQLRAGILVELFGERHMSVVDEALNVQGVLIQMHDSETTEGQLHRLERLIPQIARVPNPTYAQLHSTWALLAEEQGDNVSAEKHYRRAIDLFSRAEHSFDLNYPIAHNNYAVLLESLGRLRDALHHYKLASDLWKNELDSTCWTFRQLQDNLVRLDQEAGTKAVKAERWESAKGDFRDGLEIARRTWGDQDYRVMEFRAEIDRTGRLQAMTPDERAEFYRSVELGEQSTEAELAGNSEQALVLARARRDIVGRLCEGTTLDTIQARLAVARLLPDGEDQHAAYKSLIASVEKLLGNRHPEYASVLVDMAHHSDADEAVSIQRAKSAVDIYAGSSGVDSWDYANALSHFGQILVDARNSDAEAVLLEARTRWQNLDETEGVDYLYALSYLADVYVYLKDRPAVALKVATEVADVARSIPDYGPSDLATAVNALANAYYGIARYDRALELYLEAIEIQRQVSESSGCDREIMLRNVGDLYFLRDDYEPAVRYFKEVLDTCDAESCSDTCLEVAIFLSASYRLQERFDNASRELDRLVELLERAKEGIEREVVDEYEVRIDIQRIAISRDQAILGDQRQRKHARELLAKLWERLAPERPRKSLRDSSLDPTTGVAAISSEIWMEFLADLSAMADDLGEWGIGVETREAYAGVVERDHPETSWLVAESRCDVTEARQRFAFSEEQRLELAHADELWEQAEAAGFADGAPKGLQAIEIRTRLLGPVHRTVANSYMELANQQLESEKLERAYENYHRVVEIRRQAVGDIHLETATAKVSAAIAARRTSRHDEAETLLKEALATQSHILGEAHFDLADAYHSLAITYLSDGRYAQALTAAIEASERFASRDGEVSVDYASALRTMYWIYDSLGETEKGSEILFRSHAILKELFEPSDPECLESLYAVADLASRYEKWYEVADDVFDQLFTSLKSSNLEQTVLFSNVLNGYGNLRSNRGDLVEARQMYMQSLGVRKKLFDRPDHPSIAQAHSQIGRASLELGELGVAEKHLQTAYEFRRSRLGENSHEIVSGLYQLARVKALQGETAKALKHLRKCFEIEQRSLDENFLLGSEAAIAEVLDENRRMFALMLTLRVADGTSPAEVESALSWTLGRKGLAIDMACRLQTAERALAHRPEVVKALAKIKSLKNLLAEQTLSASDASLEGADKSILKQLDKLQRDLSLQVREARRKTARTRVEVAEIRSKMPPHSALIEFVVTPLAMLDSRHGEWTADHVLAFYVPAEGGGPCRLVDLGPAPEINATIAKLRKHIERLPRAIRISSEELLERQFQTIGQSLYQQLLGPFDQELKELNYVIFAPDGKLHGVPFAALGRSEGRYLIEDFTVGYVSSGRDLLREYETPGTGSLILADPDYNATLRGRADVASTLNDRSYQATTQQLAVRGRDVGEVRSLRWRPLPGARQEAEDVQRLLNESVYRPAQSFVGDQAVEEILKSTISPRIVHVATHGFYVPYEQAATTGPHPRGSGSGMGLARLRRASDPLLRSGIVLAGANQLAQAGDDDLEVDDGWVTAQELATIDFRNTELVVLSSCESGLGEAETGHGVHGLRRSLLIAGAHNVLTSLFEVPDDDTRQLMGSFYESLVKNRQPATALMHAQRDLIDRLRQERQSAHPFFWASFFVLGKPEIGLDSGPQLSSGAKTR